MLYWRDVTQVTPRTLSHTCALTRQRCAEENSEDQHTPWQREQSHPVLYLTPLDLGPPYMMLILPTSTPIPPAAYWLPSQFVPTLRWLLPFDPQRVFLWTECVLPKRICCSPNPHSDGIWWFCGGMSLDEVLWVEPPWGYGCLYKGIRRALTDLSQHMKTGMKFIACNWEEERSWNLPAPWTWPPACRTVRNVSVNKRNINLCILFQQPKLTD